MLSVYGEIILFLSYLCIATIITSLKREEETWRSGKKTDYMHGWDYVIHFGFLQKSRVQSPTKHVLAGHFDAHHKQVGPHPRSLFFAPPWLTSNLHSFSARIVD